MLIRVYKDRFAEVEKRLTKVGEKAAKYGVPFSWTAGAEELVEVTFVDVYEEAHTYWVLAIPVEISDEMIRMSGWTAVAMLEHLENGNVVTMFDRDEVVTEAWRTVAPHCDHCGITRSRKFTYMVRNEQGEVRQVGSTCLKEYTGIDPRASAIWAAVVDIEEEMDREGWSEDRLWGCRGWDVRDVIAHAVDSIKDHGYVKSDLACSTKNDVIDRLKGMKNPSDAGYKKADTVIEWVKGLEDGYGCEYDIAPVVKEGFCSSRHMGRLAYLPLAYDRAMERAREEAERNANLEAARAASEFVGEVGQRISFKASTAEFVTSWQTMYGMTCLYKMTDENGNVFVWYSSGSAEVEAGMTVKGTVKDHKEYDGVRQTVLTRCRVA